MNRVFSRRTYELNTEENVELEIEYPYEDAPLWRCAARVVWPGKEDFVLKSSGVDPLDALISTLKVSKILLESKEEWRNGSLTWLENSDLGLDVVVPVT